MDLTKSGLDMHIQKFAIFMTTKGKMFLASQTSKQTTYNTSNFSLPLSMLYAVMLHIIFHLFVG